MAYSFVSKETLSFSACSNTFISCISCNSQISSLIFPWVSGRKLYTQNDIIALNAKYTIGLISCVCKKLSKAGLMTKESPPKIQRMEPAALTFSGNSQLQQSKTRTQRKLVLNLKIRSKMIFRICRKQNEHSYSASAMKVSPIAAPAIAKERIKLAFFLLRVLISLQAGIQTVKSAVASTIPIQYGLTPKESTRMEEPQQRVSMRKRMMKQQIDILRSEGYLQRIKGLTLFCVSFSPFNSWMFLISSSVTIYPLFITAISLRTFIVCSSPCLMRYLGISLRQQTQKINPMIDGNTIKIPAVSLQSLRKQLERQMRRQPTVQKTCVAIEYRSRISGSQYSVKQLKLIFIVPSMPQLIRNKPTPVIQILMELIDTIDPIAIMPLKKIINGRLPNESIMKARMKTLTTKPKQMKPQMMLTTSPPQH